MVKTVKIIFLFLLLIPLAAQENTFTLVTEIWPPFRISDTPRDCSSCGIDIDVINELEERLNARIDIEFSPWARALEEIKFGRADLIIGFAFSDERAEYASYIMIPYASVEPVFYASTGSGHLIGEYGDLTGKTIGISRESVYFEPFNSDGSLKKVYFKSEKQILDMLALGRIVLAVGTNPNMAYDIARFGYRDQLELTAYKPGTPTKLYLAISRKSPKIDQFDALEQALREMIEDGTMEEILNKYR
ncbi:MAG: amino acid ABC transporter substrate-binding protein [Spirochaetales bacterium]|nr:amino acid ABC transporter substrate-binding protein [Spirochaetales bacterium]